MSSLTSSVCQSSPTRNLSVLSLLQLFVACSSGDQLAALHLTQGRRIWLGVRLAKLDSYIHWLARKPEASDPPGCTQYVRELAANDCKDKFWQVGGGPGRRARRLYSAMVKSVAWKMLQNPALSQDEACGYTLRQYVRREYYRSLIDVWRQHSTWSRYRCCGGGSHIEIYLPRFIVHRREWLDARIGSIDPTAPKERDRVQRLIDQLCGSCGIMPLESASIADLDDSIRRLWRSRSA